MPDLIRLEGIAKTYPMPGEDVHALRNVSLSFGQGEFVSIVGSSGSGKTTLLYLLGLLTDPTQGAYHFEGRDVARLSDRERSVLRGRSIGFVFQAFHLLPQLSVVENVKLADRYAAEADPDLDGKARAMLERVGLGHRLGHRPKQLSGGEMQRVAVARALLGDPKMILADEPTGNLDETNGDQIFDLLAGLSEEGKTVVVVTHDLGLAARTGRQVRLKDGEVVNETREAVA